MLPMGHEDAVDVAREKSVEVGLAQRECQLAVILAVTGEHVEGIEQARGCGCPGQSRRRGRRNAIPAVWDKEDKEPVLTLQEQ